jgi:hypothetical protein
MSIFPIPLAEHSQVLLIGAGGGFDIVCGLPIALELEAQGHTVHLANYSFTDLRLIVGADQSYGHLYKITADSAHPTAGYFPERHLAAWYRQAKGLDRPVWCLAKQGVQPTLASYNYLVGQLKIDVVVAVDGGVDGLFRGDEFELGTPSMDAISVIAASLCQARQKIYVCTAFGIEGAETRLSHAQVLHRMADLTRQEALLGVSTVLKGSAAARDFQSAVDYIHRQMETYQASTIASSLLAAIGGGYGRMAVNAKTQERQPWISPLTALYWYFRAEEVARLKLFYPQVLNSETVMEVSAAIEAVRQAAGVQPHEAIPY